MVFGGGWVSGGRFPRRRRGGGPFGGSRGGYGGGYGRGGGGGGCARDACLLESGCCLAEALGGNCLLAGAGLLPQFLVALTRAGDSRAGGARSRKAGRLLAAIAIYQQQISPRLRGRCRFEPTCSHYAAQALARHGSIRGGWLTLRRLVRCRPGGRRGHDPVPG